MEYDGILDVYYNEHQVDFRIIDVAIDVES